jgi:hypothetical protein
MPTKHRRHAITETPRVKAALDEVRAELAEGERLDLAELVVLGAETRVTRMRLERAREDSGLKALAERVRRRDFDHDIEAADEVRRTGWARS